MVPAIYFDPEHPENHTYYISNRNLTVGFMHKDGRWLLTDVNIIVDTIIEKMDMTIDKLIEEYGEELGSMFTDKLREVQIWLGVDIEGIYEKKAEEERKKLTRTEKTNIRMKRRFVKLIKQISFNYKDIILATKKRTQIR